MVDSYLGTSPHQLFSSVEDREYTVGIDLTARVAATTSMPPKNPLRLLNRLVLQLKGNCFPLVLLYQRLCLPTQVT